LNVNAKYLLAIDTLVDPQLFSEALIVRTHAGESAVALSNLGCPASACSNYEPTSHKIALGLG
jgi:hypothetical protein